MRSIIDNSILIQFDGIEYDSLTGFLRDHCITKQKGFQASVDISELANGGYELIIQPIIMDESNQVDTIGGRWIPLIKNDK